MKLYVEELTNSYNMQLEEYIKLHIKPKPKWLPNSVWQKLLKRFLVIDKFK